jgi:C4-dicarboxylate-specific signal transduction histidine kinase
MSKKRIMVVEDESITAMNIKNNLEETGYAVTSAVSTGEAAVKKAEEDQPDLVLMDIVLGGKMDGVEAASHIQSRFNIPVVYLTAYADENMIRRVRKTMPFGYIIKPFSDRELRVAVEIALYKHEMEKRLRESERELRKHREQLYELVEERTAELKSSYELLKEEIADRRMAEAEVIRASQLAALGELAAGVAHEINNPINGIINYAQLLLNKSGQDDIEKDLAARIIKESDRIAYIVRSLLSFTRDGKDNRHPVQIHEIISDTLALTEAQLKKDGITLEVDIPINLPRVIVQSQQLEQVFLNIISNARYALNQKYPGEHKNKILEIRCNKIVKKKTPHIQISFNDRGTGIPDAIRDKVMNPFYSTKPSQIGTGLGLSISHSIIKNHGGVLTIDSVEGEFTKVFIDLPAEK